MGTKSLTEALAMVQMLTPEEKHQLIAFLAQSLQHTPSAIPRLSWKDASGLGKQVWQQIDVNRYVNDLRNEWGC